MWALESITMKKASGSDGIPVELFQILKDDAVKVLPSTCQHTLKLSSGHRIGKGQFHSNPKERQCHYGTIALISHTSKVTLKILLPGFNSIYTVNFQMFKLDLEKVEEPEIKLPTSVGSSKKQENSRKTSIFTSLTTLNPLIL